MAVPEKVEAGDEITETEQTDACCSGEIDDGQDTPNAVHEHGIFDLVEPMSTIGDEIPGRIVLVHIFIVKDFSIRTTGNDERMVSIGHFVDEDAPLLTSEQEQEEIG